MRTRRRKKGEGEEGEEAPVAEASGEPPPPEEEEAEASGDRPGTKARKPPPMPVAWGNVVTDALKIGNPHQLAKRLRSELELGEHARTSYGHVLEALDRSAANYEAAGRLHRAAKLEEESYQIKAEARLETMRSAAQGELIIEYKQKERRSPTQQDIEDRMLRNWPDEYSATKGRLAEFHAAVRSLETLQQAWSSRCADLRIMADKARPV